MIRDCNPLLPNTPDASIADEFKAQCKRKHNDHSKCRGGKQLSLSTAEENRLKRRIMSIGKTLSDKIRAVQEILHRTATSLVTNEIDRKRTQWPLEVMVPISCHYILQEKK